MFFLALGSNLGDRQANLSAARRMLAQRLGVKLECSQMLETEAIGFDGKDFLNQVVAFEKEIEPLELLDVCQSVEVDMGRVKHEAVYDSAGRRVYENRIIDIDILTAGNVKVRSRRLTLPHPQCWQRPYISELVATMNEETKNKYKI